MLTLPVLTAGLILILFNGQTLKQLIFPIAFLFFLTPPPTEILYSVGSTLSDLSAHASNAIANVFGIASTISAQYGSPIITITRANQTIMNFSVDVACSGVYSLIGFVIFAVFIAYISRGKLWSKPIILLLGHTPNNRIKHHTHYNDSCDRKQLWRPTWHSKSSTP